MNSLARILEGTAREAATTGFAQMPLQALFSRYEAMKANWLREHPLATPREYEAGITRIAQELEL